MDDCMLRLEGVSKRFRRGVGHDTLVDLIAAGANRLLGRATERRTDDVFWALDDVSFEAHGGEAVGMIGPNGAGKSTALKLIAGIMRPEQGRIAAQGRVTALIDIGAGFHGDLTGRENIYLNASVLGMRKAEIARKLDAIIAFSSVEEFIDTPVKWYSSGMQARLGFSVAAHVDPDILLVDEVLSVGDVVFRQRCIERMRELVAGGTLLLFVTHHLEQMQVFCSRAVVLDHGRLIYDGGTETAVARYIAAMKHQEGVMRNSADDRYAWITGFCIRNGDGDEVLISGAAERLVMEVYYRLDRPVPRLVVDVDARQELGTLLLSFTSIRDEVTFDAPAGEGCVRLTLPSLPLAGGQYFWRASLRDADAGKVIADTDHRYTSVVEDGGKPTGILCVPHEWSLENGAAFDDAAVPVPATV